MERTQGPQANIEQLTRELDEARLELQTRTRELQESLEYQTATSEVLNVISRSTFHLQPVLDTLVDFSRPSLPSGERPNLPPRRRVYRLAAHNGFSPEYQEYMKQHPIAPGRGALVGRTALEVAPVHIPDVLADPEYTGHEPQRLGGFRAMLGVPLLREGSCVGVVSLTRSTPRRFTEKQIELVTTFADQAVIAIENVRLFDEVQARTCELQESLEYQTASSDILEVISRYPLDIRPVLDKIVEVALRLCEFYDAVIFLREGKSLKVAAHEGPITIDFDKRPISRGWLSGRAVCDGKAVHADDLSDAADEFPEGQEMALRFGARTSLAVPLLREGAAVGAILVRRAEVRPFSEKHIAVLKRLPIKR